MVLDLKLKKVPAITDVFVSKLGCLVQVTYHTSTNKEEKDYCSTWE
jgi:hypothetical protein